MKLVFLEVAVLHLPDRARRIAVPAGHQIKEQIDSVPFHLGNQKVEVVEVLLVEFKVPLRPLHQNAVEKVRTQHVVSVLPELLNIELDVLVGVERLFHRAGEEPDRPVRFFFEGETPFPVDDQPAAIPALLFPQPAADVERGSRFAHVARHPLDRPPLLVGRNHVRLILRKCDIKIGKSHPHDDPDRLRPAGVECNL